MFSCTNSIQHTFSLNPMFQLPTNQELTVALLVQLGRVASSSCGELGCTACVHCGGDGYR